MVEPAITWGSTLFYRWFHPEPVDTSIDPLVGGIASADRDPYDSNQALPTLIATKYRDRFHSLFPDLRITETKWFSLVVYPLRRRPHVLSFGGKAVQRRDDGASGGKCTGRTMGTTANDGPAARRLPRDRASLCAGRSTTQ